MIAVIGIDSVTIIYNTNTNSGLTSWKTIEAIQNGLGGGVEIIGGLWVFLISVNGLKYSTFNKYLNYFGLIVGNAGILTIIPVLKDLISILGLTQIVWFSCIGISIMKSRKLNINISL